MSLQRTHWSRLSRQCELSAKPPVDATSSYVSTPNQSATRRSRNALPERIVHGKEKGVTKGYTEYLRGLETPMGEFSILLGGSKQMVWASAPWKFDISQIDILVRNVLTSSEARSASRLAAAMSLGCLAQMRTCVTMNIDS